MLRNILIFACAILTFGCAEKTSPNVMLDNENTLTYKNNTLNEECASFLAERLSDYLVCNAWKTKVIDIDDIIKSSKKYQPNFIATRHLMTPIEVDLYRVVEKESKLYVLYPNGFVIAFKDKNYYNDWGEGYREINQSYACLVAACEKYFLWKFVDEAIIAKNPKFEEENPTSDDITGNLLEKNINSQPNFILKTDKTDINGRVCRFNKLPTDKVKNCFYYIANDTLYIYNNSPTEPESLLHKVQLKKD